MEERIIEIFKEWVDKLQNALDNEGSDEIDNLDRFTAYFDNNVKVNIDIDEGETIVVEAVIFRNGERIDCLEYRSKLLGEYIFDDYFGETYKVILVVE